MKIRFLKPVFSLWALMAVAVLPARSQETPQAPKGMKLFLLVGQSNMAGRGKVEAQDEVTNPRIWMLNKENAWVLAKDPLHFDKPAAAGVGLGSEFARTIAKEDPKANIGLIPCAFGGTSLDQWKPGGPLYRGAVERTKIAKESGTLVGILWHQGESDANPAKTETYVARFVPFVASLRKDLDAADVPFVFGELGKGWNPARDAINAVLPEAAKQVPNSALVSADGLGDKGDKLHFSSAALREFGQRYAEAWNKLAKK